MKKKFLTVLLCCALLLSGCSSQTTTTAEDSSSQTQTLQVGLAASDLFTAPPDPPPLFARLGQPQQAHRVALDPRDSLPGKRLWSITAVIASL